MDNLVQTDLPCLDTRLSFPLLCRICTFPALSLPHHHLYTNHLYCCIVYTSLRLSLPKSHLRCRCPGVHRSIQKDFSCYFFFFFWRSGRKWLFLACQVHAGSLLCSACQVHAILCGTVLDSSSHMPPRPPYGAPPYPLIDSLYPTTRLRYSRKRPRPPQVQIFVSLGAVQEGGERVCL